VNEMCAVIVHFGKRIRTTTAHISGMVELPGIEPGSYDAASGLLRVQFV